MKEISSVAELDDFFFIFARDEAIRQLRQLHASNTPVGGYVDLAHRALWQAATEQRRRLTGRLFRRYTEAIVEELRRV
jgi:hypothetical protein